MRFADFAAGVSAATIAWRPLGWTPVWYSEKEKYACRVLSHHYPDVPNLGDALQIESNEIFTGTTIDLLVGGTPCQSFSIAGLRGGLKDKRGNLALRFCRVLAIKRPRWFVWENVPGVLSLEKGEAFRSILQGFSLSGYSVAWRILDAQFFGVPQQRQRLFVVGHLGSDWRPPSAVLFERSGVYWDTATKRRDPEELATYIRKGLAITGRDGFTEQLAFRTNNTSGPITVASSLTTRNDRFYFNSETFIVSRGGIVRRLTPLEYERCQGFPDGYTDLGGAKDRQRYRVIGNSIPVPVIRWIGERIQRIDQYF